MTDTAEMFHPDPTGLTTVSAGRTIGEGDFSLLVNLTWLTGEAHVNRLHSGDGEDARVLPPVLVAAIGMGLGWTATMRSKLINEYGLHAVRSSSLTITGGETVKPGDTLRVWSTVNSITQDQEPEIQLLDIAHDVRNQSDQTTVTISQELLVVARSIKG